MQVCNKEFECVHGGLEIRSLDCIEEIIHRIYISRNYTISSQPEYGSRIHIARHLKSLLYGPGRGIMDLSFY